MNSARSIFQPTQSYGSLTSIPNASPVPLLSVNDTGESIEAVSVVSEPEINNSIQIPSDVFSFLDIESLIAVNKINKQAHRSVVDRVKVLEQLQLKPADIRPLRRFEIEARKNPLSRLDKAFKKISRTSVRLQAQILKNAIHYILKNTFTIPAEKILLPSSPVDLIVRPGQAPEDKPTAHIINMPPTIVMPPIVSSPKDGANIKRLKFFNASIRDILSVYKEIDEKTRNPSVTKNIKNLFLLKLKEKYFYLQYSIGFDVTAGGVDIKNLLDCHSSVRDVLCENRKIKAYNLLYSALALGIYFIADEVPMNKLLAYGICMIAAMFYIASLKNTKARPDVDIHGKVYLNRNLLFTSLGNQRLVRLINQANASSASAAVEAEVKSDAPANPRLT